MLDGVLDEVQAFSQQKDFEDDICLVAVERAESSLANIVA
jgi:serine phosphatase RsbU (regulator of sigma subunit)